MACFNNRPVFQCESVVSLTTGQLVSVREVCFNKRPAGQCERVVCFNKRPVG